MEVSHTCLHNEYFFLVWTPTCHSILCTGFTIFCSEFFVFAPWMQSKEYGCGAWSRRLLAVVGVSGAIGLCIRRGAEQTSESDAIMSQFSRQSSNFTHPWKTDNSTLDNMTCRTTQHMCIYVCGVTNSLDKISPTDAARSAQISYLGKMWLEASFHLFTRRVDGIYPNVTLFRSM
jgi:hypothetical protein